MTGFGQQHLMRFFVAGVVARHLNLAATIGGFFTDLQGQQGWHFINFVIQVSVIFSLARNNQRRAGFIDQNRIDFIDNRKI